MLAFEGVAVSTFSWQARGCLFNSSQRNTSLWRCIRKGIWCKTVPKQTRGAIYCGKGAANITLKKDSYTYWLHLTWVATASLEVVRVNNLRNTERPNHQKKSYVTYIHVAFGKLEVCFSIFFSLIPFVFCVFIAVYIER